ncbi:MAG: dethiobiotin synthase [Haliangiales bacterium]
MREYFITGTDTEVGKTTMARALLAAATAAGLDSRCFKPAESGCPSDERGALQPQDALALWRAGGQRQDRDSVCAYRFRDPVAPGVAAAREGVSIDFAVLAQAVDALRAENPDLLIVEGAGGLLVPMGEGRMIRDLARMLSMPLLVVARPSLGTINHTLLTVESARASGIEVAGVVFSAAAGNVDRDAVASNRAEIEAASGVTVFGCLPHLPNASDADLANAARDCLALDVILS